MRFIRNEIKTIKEVTDDFCLIAVKAGDWNADLSPWKAPAVFGSEDFGDGAGETLKEVLKLCTENSKDYYIDYEIFAENLPPEIRVIPRKKDGK